MTNVENDYQFFVENRKTFFALHKHEFVLVRDKKSHGFFKAVEAALVAGLELFGDSDFLIQEITDEISTTRFVESR